VTELAFAVPPELVEAIAELVEERVLERLEAHRRASISPFLTPAEAAELLRAGRQRVYDLLSAGRLRRYKDGARVLVSRDELEAYLDGDGTRRIDLSLPPAQRSRASSGFGRRGSN
jgi:excisionase family DNA binding protein